MGKVKLQSSKIVLLVCSEVQIGKKHTSCGFEGVETLLVVCWWRKVKLQSSKIVLVACFEVQIEKKHTSCGFEGVEHCWLCVGGES